MEDKKSILPFGMVDEEKMISFCQELIQIPSYTGQEQEVADYIVERMLTLGYDRAWVDGVGNVIGEIRGEKSGPKLLYDGHIDTIPVSGSEEWINEPFEGIIEDGYLYGRGAMSKGALASMVYGLAPLVQHKAQLAGSVFVSGTVGKEQFEGLAFRQVMQVIKPDYVIISEATGLNICHGQRGRAQIIAMTSGKAAHSAIASAGKNAGYRMLSLVQEMLKQATFSKDSLGQGSLELTHIASAPSPSSSTVPHKCWATFDRYIVQGETEEAILEPFHKVIEFLQAEDVGFEAEVGIVETGIECYTGQYLTGKRFFPAWMIPSEHELVSRSLTALTTAGFSPKLSCYQISTNGSYSAGMAKVPTIGFGPGCQEDMHIADERLELSQLRAAAKGYQVISYPFLFSE